MTSPSTSPNPNPVTLDLLLPLPEEGEPPVNRLPDALSAEQILWALIEGDKKSSFSRAAVDAMIDGEPPYEAKKLREAGQSNRCNLNFLEGAATIEAALTGYLDLTNSVPMIAQVDLDTGDSTLDSERSQIASEEFHHLHKNLWDEFEVNMQLLSSFFVAQGIGIAYRESDLDWRWSASRLGDFLIQRGTTASEGELELAFCRRAYRPHRLYKFIEDPETAAEVGWNVEVTRKAIAGAIEEDPSVTRRGDWEAVERQLKANDLHVSLTRGKEIHVAHVWVLEFDGTVSHKIILQKGNSKEFLYERLSKFENIHQAFSIFTYGVGNGEYHSIRGLGYKIFPFVQVSNRLRCQAIDGAALASSLLIQPKDDEDLQNLGLTQFGPYSVLPANLNVVTVQLPDVGQKVLPVIRDLSQMMEANTGSYKSRGTQPNGQERTKFEVQAQVQKEAVLSVSAMSLFYLPLKRVYTETFRRLIRDDYAQTDPGGKEALEFRRRCLKRGVTLEMLKSVKSVAPVRAIGYGSAEMRVLALDEFQALAPQMDDVGRANLLRDRVAARVGFEGVDRYVPKTAVPRPTQEQRNAEFENTALRMGQAQVVFGDDRPLPHLKIHLPALSGLVMAIQQGASDGLAPLMTFLDHCGQHLQKLGSDQSEDAKAAFGQVKKVLSQAQELAQQLQQKAQADALAQQQQAQQGQQMDPKTLATLQQNQLKLQADQQKMQADMQAHQQRMQMHEEASKQKMALSDLAAAHKMQQTTAQQ